MALSDDERRRLEELENLLSTEDPSWARTLGKGQHGDGGPRRLVLAVLAVVAGLALVLVGVATRLVLVGAAGFVLQCAAAYWLLAGLNGAGLNSFFPRTPGGKKH